MNYKEFWSNRRGKGGRISATLLEDGNVLVHVEPNQIGSIDGKYDYHYTAGMGGCVLNVSAKVADDLMAVIGECLIEKARQDGAAEPTVLMTEGEFDQLRKDATEYMDAGSVAAMAEIGGEG